MKNRRGKSVVFFIYSRFVVSAVTLFVRSFLGLSDNSTFLSFPPSCVMIPLAFLSCFLSTSLRTKQLLFTNSWVFQVLCVRI